MTLIRGSRSKRGFHHLLVILAKVLGDVFGEEIEISPPHDVALLAATANQHYGLIAHDKTALPILDEKRHIRDVLEKQVKASEMAQGMEKVVLKGFGFTHHHLLDINPQCLKPYKQTPVPVKNHFPEVEVFYEY